MIRKANEQDMSTILEYVSRDCARNYFILMGLIKGPQTFKDIYIEEDSEIKALFISQTVWKHSICCI